MTDNNPLTFRATHPGRIARRELKARGWSMFELALYTDSSLKFTGDFLDGKADMTPEFCEKLAQALDTDLEFWSNLWESYLRDKSRGCEG